MRKTNLLMTGIFTVLFLCTCMMGCKGADPGSTIVPPNLAGKVIILQAYGSSATAAGVSHSFVELYNKDNAAVSLSGVSLYYADGTDAGSGNTNNNTSDGAWKRISLEGKTIPAKSSFLILGKKESLTAARYQIPDGSGDINDNTFTLSNRAFKVALIQSTEALSVQNPFTSNSGKPISGYIDMVGAANEYGGRDKINGFEKLPARNSASEAVRRADLNDYDDNSTDFIAARYASDGMTDEELEVRKPRKSSATQYNPFTPPEVLTQTVAGAASANATKLLILQVYGTGTATDGAVSHSFIELYNNTDAPISLSTYSLQYANGVGTSWSKINLTGSIPAKGSYLVIGNKNNASGRLQLVETEADQKEAFYLDNNNFKVALMANQNKLTVANPFAMTGGTAAGYVDMVGVKNGNGDNIDGYETALAQVISKQKAARRNSLTDNNDNSTEFVDIDYRLAPLDKYKPRYSGDDVWSPFAVPDNPTVSGAQSSLAGQLLILQAGAALDGAIARNFVELYNNTNAPITLTGTYSLQYAGATGADWEPILLDGTIPAHGSFLVVGKVATVDPVNRLLITDGDADQLAGDNFVLSNNGFKVALIANQDRLTVANPFDMGSGAKAKDYVDMLGAWNSGNHTDGYENVEAAVISKQASARRKSLTDTNDNSADFERIDYRQSGGISNARFALVRPRNSTETASGWNPIIAASETLMILQANTFGNNNGGYESSMVELYNNTNASIDLNAGNYYLHIGEGSSTTTNNGWTYVIELTGTIPPHCSYLIRTSNTSDMFNTPYLLPTADQIGVDPATDFRIINDNFKVAVIQNQSSFLTVDNPFTGDGGQPIAGYVDMLGVGNATGFEGRAGATSKPQPPRRTSLVDYNDNIDDFAQFDSRSSGVPANQLYKYWPRNISGGAWDPITGNALPANTTPVAGPVSR